MRLLRFFMVAFIGKLILSLGYSGGAADGAQALLNY